MISTNTADLKELAGSEKHSRRSFEKGTPDTSDLPLCTETHTLIRAYPAASLLRALQTPQGYFSGSQTTVIYKLVFLSNHRVVQGWLF